MLPMKDRNVAARLVIALSELYPEFVAAEDALECVVSDTAAVAELLPRPLRSKHEDRGSRSCQDQI